MPLLLLLLLPGCGLALSKQEWRRRMLSASFPLGTYLEESWGRRVERTLRATIVRPQNNVYPGLAR